MIMSIDMFPKFGDEEYEEPLTGWHCIVCHEPAQILGEGFTWCDIHWDKWDMGKGTTIHKMINEFKEKNK
jgi:hypothetical protein